MRTSLNKIKAIDDYLLGQLPPGDSLIFEANMLLDGGFTAEVQEQQEAYAMIRQYSRKKIKAEIMAVQEALAKAPQQKRFMQRVTNLFKK